MIYRTPMTTKEKLLKIVNAFNREQLRSLWYEFHLIGFYLYDYEKLRDEALECIENNYTTKEDAFNLRNDDSLRMEKVILNICEQ